MKNKNKKIIVYVCLLILCISVGYAALSTTLNITGVSNIKSAKWDVHFDNLKVNNDSVTATSPAVIDATKTAVNYSVSLLKPGDSYSFTVDVVNAGTIDAMVSVVSNTGLSDEQKKYISYSVTYSNDLDVNTKDSLNAGYKRKLRVIVKYRTDLDASDLPTEDKILNLTFKVTYIQADSSKNDIVTGSIMNNDGTGNYHSDTYKSKITKIVTSNKLVVPNNVVEKWDVSKNQDESVMAYAEDDGKIYLEGSYGGFFSNFSALTSMDLSDFDTKNVVSMNGLFALCVSLTELSLNSFDTSNVTDMNFMFGGCNNLISIDLSSFKTSKLTSITAMFAGCINLTSINFKNATFDNVTSYGGAFSGCSKLAKIIVKDTAAKNFISGKASGVDVSIA